MSISIEDDNQKIVYQGQWSRQRSVSASGGSFTSTRDNRASLALSFIGTQISVICSVTTRHNDGALFSIDNSPPQQLSHTSSSQNQRPCWTSPTLSPAPHVLIIRNTEDTEIRIDRIDVVPSDLGGPPPSDPLPTPPAPLPPVASTSPNAPPPNTPVTVTVSLSNNQQSTSPPDLTPNPPSLSSVTAILPPLSPNALQPSSSLVATFGPSSTTDYAGVFSSILATDTGALSSPTPITGTVVSSASAERSKAGIVGGVLGSLLALFLLGIIAFFALKRRKKNQFLDSEIEPPYTGYNDSNYENLPSPTTRAPNATLVTPYTVAPAQTQYYSYNQGLPASHPHYPNNQHPRPASFSSSMYTDGPPLRAS